MFDAIAGLIWILVVAFFVWVLSEKVVFSIFMITLGTVVLGGLIFLYVKAARL